MFLFFQHILQILSSNHLTPENYNTFKLSIVQKIMEEIKATSNIQEEYENSLKNFIATYSSVISEKENVDFQTIATTYINQCENIFFKLLFFLYNSKNIGSTIQINDIVQLEVKFFAMLSNLLENLNDLTDLTQIQDEITLDFNIFMNKYKTLLEHIDYFEKKGYEKCDDSLKRAFDSLKSVKEKFEIKTTDFISQNLEFGFMKSYCMSYVMLQLKEHHLKFYLLNSLKNMMKQ